MPKKDNFQNDFYELTEHNGLQIGVIFIIFISFNAILYTILLPFLEEFFVEFLNGRVFNDGKFVGVSIEANDPSKSTHYLYAWAIDIYLKTASEARYWFNPLLSLFIPVGFISLNLSLLFSLVLPQNVGYLRQKFEREIAKVINQIISIKYGFQTDNAHENIVEEILAADIRDIHELAENWSLSFTDLLILYNALKWRHQNFFGKILNINSAIRFYMHFHFTVKYGNAVLGLVYIGAAVLIIIVGLRGLKFIPPTQPSLVLFALGLEFTLLIAYAVTLMYSKQEEEETDKSKEQKQKLINGEFGSAKEVESMLKVFLKSRRKK